MTVEPLNTSEAEHTLSAMLKDTAATVVLAMLTEESTMPRPRRARVVRGRYQRD